MSEYVIGVDIGTQSTKALLTDARGRIVAQHSQGYQPDTPRPRWAEQWPQVWLDAVEASVAGCVAAAASSEPGFAPAQVRALCISSLYGGSGIPVDAAMQAVHPCLIWMDRRAIAQVDWVKRNVDLDWLYDVTGNGVDSYYGYTKMMWLRDERPEAWKRTRWFVPPNAFVIHALTGELAVDHSSAGNIGGVYDNRRGTWSAEACERLGLDARMLPERLLRSSERVAGLTAAAAKRLGLVAGTPVIAGGIDAAMATFAAGVTRQGQHVAMMGSSMCWGTITREVDARRGLVSMPYVYGAPEDRYVFGGASTAGAAVTWLANLLRGARAWGGDATPPDAALLASLEAEAQALPPGAEGLVFLPYLMGERSPIWDGEASGAFVGLNLVHGRAHLYRAVLEGVSLALRHNMEAGAAATLDEGLVVVGGAARSDLWMQIIADVTRRNVRTIAEDVEAPMGAALLAASAMGLVDAAEVARGWVTLAPRAAPSEDAAKAYDRSFGIYKALYPALKDSMHALAR